MKTNGLYRIVLKPEPEGGYTVTVPTLIGCVTFGETVEAALINAKEAIELYLETLQAQATDIPTDDGTLEYHLYIDSNAQVAQPFTGLSAFQG